MTDDLREKAREVGTTMATVAVELCEKHVSEAIARTFERAARLVCPHCEDGRPFRDDDKSEHEPREIRNSRTRNVVATSPLSRRAHLERKGDERSIECLETNRTT